MNIKLDTSKRNYQMSNNHLLTNGCSEKNAGSDKRKSWNIKCILSLLLGIIFFTSVPVKAKELTTKYSIHMLGANIGEFTVTQTNINGNINIDAITEVKVNLLFSYRIKYV